MLATVPNIRLQFNNILFPTDFSVFSEAALPYAETLARRYEATLYPAHVVPPQPNHGFPMEPFPMTLDCAIQAAEEGLARVNGLEELKDIPHQTLLKQGLLWDVMAKMVERNHIDLIVLGTHGRTGLSRLAMGSVAEEIYRRASCPVLCVGPMVPHAAKQAPEFRRILFATDFSEASRAALPYALTLAEESQARLVLLHLIPLVPVADREQVRTEGIARLKALLPPDAGDWCKVEFDVRFEFPAEAIVRAAERRGSEVIVMGVRQNGHARAVSHLPWATATEVVATAGCPVLTVRG
jgi:nucleotide-binding universal stress UspA family protein